MHQLTAGRKWPSSKIDDAFLLGKTNSVFEGA
jgi:hypothetical protein